MSESWSSGFIKSSSIMIAVVSFFWGVVLLVASCTNAPSPHVFLREFTAGWACVFVSIVVTMLVFRR